MVNHTLPLIGTGDVTWGVPNRSPSPAADPAQHLAAITH